MSVEFSRLLSPLSDLVRDLRLTPAKEKFRVGDELQCSAKGNPAPSVSLLPSLLPVHAKSGPGWTTLSISQKWEGQRVNIQCTASNTVGSVTEIQSSNLTIHVSGILSLFCVKSSLLSLFKIIVLQVRTNC